ncbi:hypothetical protein ACFV06_16885 [Streptomyces sp. NPDC059618]|uniref:hypothetical protein n=1 Tax=Streptomyces sp. NPDC059618 TaxID=3346887 RepID=UPI003676E081
MSKAATSAATKHLTSLALQPDTLDVDPVMQARLEEDVARIMAAISDPTAAFEALTAERGIQVVEWDTSTLDSKLRDGFLAHYLEHKDSRRILVVPTGQDPVIRLRAVRSLLSHQGVTA